MKFTKQQLDHIATVLASHLGPASVAFFLPGAKARKRQYYLGAAAMRRTVDCAITNALDQLHEEQHVKAQNAQADR